VWDNFGKSYLDLLSGTWCNVLGYQHPQWTSAMNSHASHLTHTGARFASEELRHALSKLAEIMPAALSRAVFLNTGSEAVELALKMARAATGADCIVVIARSYYGATTYALTLSEVGRNARYLPVVGSVVRLPAPECRRCPMGLSWPCARFPCLDSLSRFIYENHKAIAAVLYEPILANGGVIIPPKGYGSRLRSLVSQSNGVLIAEEVTTGIGRTGRWFGFEHDAIVPDILVLGKALGAGYPVSAVVTTDAVEARCHGLLTHVQSHQNDPSSGRMAASVISIMQDEGLLQRAAQRGRHLLEGLQQIQSRHPEIVEVRGRGCMVGIELIPDRAHLGIEIAQRLMSAGFIVDYQPQNETFRLFPPYIITTEEIDSFLHAFDQALAAL
jgi:4-aminobutyrate aminotransferase-like enzyme